MGRTHAAPLLAADLLGSRRVGRIARRRTRPTQACELGAYEVPSLGELDARFGDHFRRSPARRKLVSSLVFQTVCRRDCAG